MGWIRDRFAAAKLVTDHGPNVSAGENAANPHYEPSSDRPRVIRRGDILLAISTSGTSANILRAAEAARALGVNVIALTGRAGSKLDALADIGIATAGTSGYADRVQELHIKVIHILIELVERELAPANYLPPRPAG